MSPFIMSYIPLIGNLQQILLVSKGYSVPDRQGALWARRVEHQLRSGLGCRSRSTPSIRGLQQCSSSLNYLVQPQELSRFFEGPAYLNVTAVHHLIHACDSIVHVRMDYDRSSRPF